MKFCVVQTNRLGMAIKVIAYYERRSAAEAMLPLYRSTGGYYEVRPWAEIAARLDNPPSYSFGR